jgi:hypothetical protein
MNYQGQFMEDGGQDVRPLPAVHCTAAAVVPTCAMHAPPRRPRDWLG